MAQNALWSQHRISGIHLPSQTSLIITDSGIADGAAEGRVRKDVKTRGRINRRVKCEEIKGEGRN